MNARLLEQATLALADPEIYRSIQGEEERQLRNLELIASENYVSAAVREAAGSVMTNKYAEGYPGRRYYGGCEYVDVAETLAVERLKTLFGAAYANVQPHSGAQANMAVYFTALQPGDTIMGTALDHGGHLTHGSKVSFSGKMYKVVTYGVSRRNERFDYDEIRAIAQTHKPKMLVTGWSAYARIPDWKAFADIAHEVGASLFADIAHVAGLVAAGFHPTPVGHADYITSTTHKTLRGPRGGVILTDAERGKAIAKTVFPGLQGGPLMHVIAAKAVCFGEALKPEFKDYARQVVANAKRLARGLESQGWRIVTGGTDNHLMLVDVSVRGLTGKAVEEYLDDIGITVNKNTIPFDKNPPAVASGIRLGTPAITTRGMKEPEMDEIAQIMGAAMEDIGKGLRRSTLRSRVYELTSAFGVP
ncbi:MAG: serine hydroxymethyltransferase [Candidatus Eremiobacter antarcticus]|nr:serine hydroxymethyltransferase [Candidatus Eremiobacteraeota bacterium]MBC5808241.1 serine hydroxymethyltransferase [Candidatus Eremiobacteraeota bacterium]PZR63626.1 MAG: serine hydroxymethyltransferase [Candidatus Eremiobacter sp. RRmetagenome_bin22]